MSRRNGLVAKVAAWAAVGMAWVVSAWSLPIDDFWLSLASARAIGNGASLDRAVDLTWTPMIPGALNPQWLGQLVLGLPGSEWGALAVNALLIGAGLALTYLRVRRRAGGAASAIAMLLAIGVLAPHLLARAQSFSIALWPLALLLLETRLRRSWLLPVAFGLLIALWANLHGAFVIGQLAAFTAATLEIGGWLRDRSRRPAGPVVATAIVAAVAPLANPAGIGLLAYAYGQPGLDVVRAISVEWGPSWPWVSVATVFWAYLVVLVAGRLVRRDLGRCRDCLLGALLAALAISSIRHIPWFVLAMAPLLAADIEALLAARPRIARALGTVGGPMARQLSAVVAVLALLALLVQPVRTSLPQAFGRVTPDEPVAVVDRLDAVLAAGAAPARILNEQVWGGYLDYRLGRRAETAMDGRLEIRDTATWSRYFDWLHGEPGTAEDLAAAGVRFAILLPERQALIEMLSGAGWSSVLVTSQAVLLEAP
ncbi:MAG TPA: hypothetical protein VF013_06095 [Candidatus Limnocylindria bacterium]